MRSPAGEMYYNCNILRDVIDNVILPDAEVLMLYFGRWSISTETLFGTNLELKVNNFPFCKGMRALSFVSNTVVLFSTLLLAF